MSFGAPCHTAHSVVKFQEQACPAFIEPDAWPPKSPVLSPFNLFVWSELERMVYSGQEDQHHRGAEGKADGLLGPVVPETAGSRSRSCPQATAGLRDGPRSSR